MTFSERDRHNIRTGKGSVVGLVYSGYCQSLLLHCASPYRLSRCEAEKTRTVTGLRLSPSCHGSGRLGLPLPASDTDWSGPWPGHGRLKRYSDCYYRGICLSRPGWRTLKFFRTLRKAWLLNARRIIFSFGALHAEFSSHPLRIQENLF